MKSIIIPSKFLRHKKHNWGINKLNPSFKIGSLEFNYNVTAYIPNGKDEYQYAIQGFNSIDMHYYAELVRVHEENRFLGIDDEDYNEQIREAIDQGETDQWLKER